MIQALLNLSSPQWLTSRHLISVECTKTSTIAKDFFSNLILHPTKHLVPIIFMTVVLIVVAIGLMFLVKLVYERYGKDKA